VHGDLSELRIKIFADGADANDMGRMAGNPLIKGFTTNPTLMRKAGVDDYKSFATRALAAVSGKPISFEVLGDDFESMRCQAETIACWGDNVFVKIPVTNTSGESSIGLIRKLSAEGIQVNVTAVFTLGQVWAVCDALAPDTPAVVSVFAGRIADTGRDPMPMMRACKELVSGRPKAELLWASPREVLNLFQAEECGSDIITMTRDQIAKLSAAGKDLDEFSRETVEMFYRDATAAAYSIEIETPAMTDAAE
jgi:transaldolase